MMIVYDLICIHGHTFEGWFDDTDALERQIGDRLISCPVCGSDSVSKKPSAVAAIRSSGNSDRGVSDPKEAIAMLKKITDFIDKNFENVGSRFTAEALKIHYGVTEPRNIRGSSTPEEEKVLESEGVGFIKLPTLKTPDPEQ